MVEGVRLVEGVIVVDCVVVDSVMVVGEDINVRVVNEVVSHSRTVEGVMMVETVVEDSVIVVVEGVRLVEGVMIMDGVVVENLRVVNEVVKYIEGVMIVDDLVDRVRVVVENLRIVNEVVNYVRMVEGVTVVEKVMGDSVTVLMGGSLNNKGLPHGGAVRCECSGCTPVKGCTRGVGDGNLVVDVSPCPQPIQIRIYETFIKCTKTQCNKPLAQQRIYLQ